MHSTTTSALPSARVQQQQWTDRLRDGALVHIRPIDTSDIPREHAFLKQLSPELRAFRFLGLIKSIDARVARELTADDSDEVTLVALVDHDDNEIEIGVARYRADAHGRRCDCAVTVAREWQQRGVGRILMQHLIDVARSAGIRHMYAVDPTRCAGAHLLAERLGFHCRPDPEDPVVTTFELTLP